MIVGGRRYLNERIIKSGSRLYEIDIQNLTAFAASPLGEIIGDRSADKRVPDYIWKGSLALQTILFAGLVRGRWVVVLAAAMYHQHQLLNP